MYLVSVNPMDRSFMIIINRRKWRNRYILELLATGNRANENGAYRGLPVFCIPTNIKISQPVLP